MTLPRISAWLAWLTVTTAVAFYVVIVAGGIVRVTGSGLGCPDWPQCYGQWVPPLEVAAWIEFAHRVAASAGSLLLAATAVTAWRAYRRVAWVILPTLLAVGLLAIQIGLGAVTVLLELPPAIVVAHLGTALLLLAMVVAMAVAAFVSHLPPPQSVGNALAQYARRLSRHLLWTALATFGLLLTGALVAATFATWSCPGIPWCEQQLLSLSSLAWLQMLHRIVAIVITGLLAWLVVRGWRLGTTLPGLHRVGLMTVGLALAQIGVGVGGVLLNFQPWLQGLHLAIATLFWSALVVLVVLARLGADRLAVATVAADQLEPADRWPVGWPRTGPAPTT